MIKADNNDLDNILNYISDDYEKCLYIYLDIKEYGLEDERLNLWYLLDDNCNIDVLIMKYYKGMHIYSRDLKFNKDKVIELIKKEEPNMISGMSTTIDYLNYIPSKFIKEKGKVIKCNSTIIDNTLNVTKASFKDLDEICSLLEKDVELGKPYGYSLLYKQLSERYNNGYGTNYIIKKDEEIIAHCGTYAQNNKIGVIGGFIVKDRFKGNGYGKIVLSGIVGYLSNIGIETYGYCYIPSALNTFKKIGSTIIGDWTKLSLEE